MCKKPSAAQTSKEVAPQQPPPKNNIAKTRRRRTKRDKQATVAAAVAAELARRRREEDAAPSPVAAAGRKKSSSSSSGGRSKRRSNAKMKHDKDKPSGGVEALLPSVAIVAVLAFGVMAKMGFRGRADVAGIDLGTTNSVVCVQAPSDKGGVGTIECIPDPANNSPIIPSVVSFLDHAPGSGHSSSHGNKSSNSAAGGSSTLEPNVVVGHRAKLRIDTHPHHTLYHAKRVIGRPHGHDAVKDLMEEVEFDVVPASDGELSNDGDGEGASEADESDGGGGGGGGGVQFRVPYHSTAPGGGDVHRHLLVTPQQVGSYVVSHLIRLTQNHLGHDNVRTAVIAIPAKFDDSQRIATVQAFRDAGVKVARILEEPTAAALAYGLHKKDGVNYIMVYDFGGGTLDVSVLHVSDGGYVDVMGSDGDNRLGGADFDAAVAHALLEKDGGDGVVQRVTDTLKDIEGRLQKDGIVAAEDDLEELLAEGCPVLEETPPCTLSSFHTIGEKMKIGLSSYPDGGGEVEEVCLGLPEGETSTPMTISDFCSALKPVKLTLTSAEYDTAVQELYRRALLPVRRILADLNLKKDEIDEVVMVGGTTRMPRIRVMVRDELGVSSLNTHIDPDLTVAYGAASVID